MKTFLFGCLLFIIGLFLCVTLIFAQQQEARMMQGVIGGGVPAAGGACTTYESYLSTSDDSVWMNAEGKTYVGQLWKPTAGVSVCQVDFKLTKQGDISALAYNVKIWTLVDGDPQKNLLGCIGTSDNSVPGSNSWAGTVVSFTFSTSVNLTLNTFYAITISRTDAGWHDTNFIRLHYYATATAPFADAGEQVSQYDSSQVIQVSAAWTSYINIYTQ